MANSADPDQKPTDLDLHCLQRQDISGFSRTRQMANAKAERLLFEIHIVPSYLQNHCRSAVIAWVFR